MLLTSSLEMPAFVLRILLSSFTLNVTSSSSVMEQSLTGGSLKLFVVWLTEVWTTVCGWEKGVEKGGTEY